MDINTRLWAVPVIVGILVLAVGCGEPVSEPVMPTSQPATPTAEPTSTTPPAPTETPLPVPTAPPVATPGPVAEPTPTGGVIVVPGDPSLSDPMNVTPVPTPMAGGALPESPAEAASLLAQALVDVAPRAGVAATQVQLVEIEQVEWRDGSLGCPQPGMMYPQVITPGYRFVIEADGERYEYHTDMGSQVILCERPS